jgi:murein DD-endopeptidase MepM/ murein hydrolase activator NlpD
MRWLAVLSPLLFTAPAAPAAQPVHYERPVPGAVVRPFDDVGQYEAGHRGVDLATVPDEPVRTAAAGEVTFAGQVAGRGVVVVLHADGLRTTYEPVEPLVRVDQRLSAGAVLGRVTGAHEGCSPGRCLHWGVRRGELYLDPMTLLANLAPVRLLPWDG